MKPLAQFHIDLVRTAFGGGWRYWATLGVLAVVLAVALLSYTAQLAQGLVLTNLSDQVSWGLYIANFVYFGGIASSGLALVVAGHLYRRHDVASAALMGLTIAIPAIIVAILSILADLGRPDRLWHMLPLLGTFNFPQSMLTWDSLALNSYLLFTVVLAAIAAYGKYRGTPALTDVDPGRRWLGVLAVGFILFMLVVEAFLFSSHVARPHWNTAILVPRLLASAFASGSALYILVLLGAQRFAARPAEPGVLQLLVRIAAFSVVISVLLVAVEWLLTLTGGEGAEASARYLFYGLEGASRLTPWIWCSVVLGIAAAVMLSRPQAQHPGPLLVTSCVFAIIFTWIEKTMGLVIGGFIPSPMGEVFEYLPSLHEVMVSLGILAVGLLIFMPLARIVIQLDRGTLRYTKAGE